MVLKESLPFKSALEICSGDQFSCNFSEIRLERNSLYLLEWEEFLRRSRYLLWADVETYSFLILLRDSSRAIVEWWRCKNLAIKRVT